MGGLRVGGVGSGVASSARLMWSVVKGSGMGRILPERVPSFLSNGAVEQKASRHAMSTYDAHPSRVICDMLANNDLYLT